MDRFNYANYNSQSQAFQIEKGTEIECNDLNLIGFN